MKVKIFQDAIVFVSAITVEQFKKAKRFIPQALTLYSVDENSKKKTPICTIDYANEGSVNKNGIVFDSTTDAGNLCYTVVNAEGFDPHLTAAEKERVVSEKFAGLILKVNELEDQIVAKLEDNEAKITTAQQSVESITVE